MLEEITTAGISIKILYVDSKQEHAFTNGDSIVTNRDEILAFAQKVIESYGNVKVTVTEAGTDSFYEFFTSLDESFERHVDRLHKLLVDFESESTRGAAAGAATGAAAGAAAVAVGDEGGTEHIRNQIRTIMRIISSVPPRGRIKA